MEYIDIVDENGNKTGEIRSRVDVHKYGLLFQAVHLWVVNSKSEILLQKRSDNLRNFPGKWDISAGGALVQGEELIDAVKKESFEEIGLSVDESKLKFIGTISEQVVYNDYIDNGICSIYITHSDLPIDDFTKKQNEVQDLKWFPLMAFKKMVAEQNPELVPHWQEYELLIKELEK